MLSITQIAILSLLQEYVIADRSILQAACGIKDDARMREILRAMTAKGWIDRVQIKSECLVGTKPVYFANEAGCALLASVTGDMGKLHNCRAPKTSFTYFTHYLGVTRALLRIVKALRSQVDVELVRFLTEHHYVRPGKMLLTEVGEGRRGRTKVCAPDGAFVIRRRDRCRVYFFEFSTGSDGSPTREAAKKSPGYAAFIGGMIFKQLFPEADDAKVLAIVPNIGYREHMRRALQGKGGEHWLLVRGEDLETDFIHVPVFHSPIAEEPTPLVRTPPPSPVAPEPTGVTSGEVSLIVNR